jgi:hypothetical protein
MKLFLSRQANGLYMLTAIRPKRHRVGNTNHDDLYIRAGEPIGHRNMCPASIEMPLPDFRHLEPLETTEVEISAKVCARREEPISTGISSATEPTCQKCEEGP